MTTSKPWALQQPGMQSLAALGNNKQMNRWNKSQSSFATSSSIYQQHIRLDVFSMYFLIFESHKTSLPKKLRHPPKKTITQQITIPKKKQNPTTERQRQPTQQKKSAPPHDSRLAIP